jgi:hypothetical protein
VRISVMDKLARKQLEVEPRQFDGRLLHQVPSVRTSYGVAYVELYVTEPAEPSRVALYRSGTRVVEVLGSLPGLEHAPWTNGSKPSAYFMFRVIPPMKKLEVEHWQRRPERF